MGRGVDEYIDFLVAHPSFMRLVIRDSLSGGRFLQRLPEHLASLTEALTGMGPHMRAEDDPAHLLLSAIALCWFPLVIPALVSDLGLDAASPDFVAARKREVKAMLLAYLRR